MTETEQTGINISADVQKVLRALRGESMRSKVILLAAAIDDVLLKMLKKHLKAPRKKEDRLFGPMRPLNSFSARIEMAYRLGLISKEMADCFDILREIRNDCAHQIFEQSEVFTQKLKRFMELTLEVHNLEPLLISLMEKGKNIDPFLLICCVYKGHLELQLSGMKQVSDSYFGIYRSE